MDDNSAMLSVSKRLLSIEQLGERLNCSKWSIYKLIDQRAIPFIPLGKRLYRFDPEMIDKWIKERALQVVE